MNPNLQPLVSVILPAYNSALYIGQALESILNQSFSDFEILIFDDCSTDDTVAIIESYTDSRIQLIRKEKNTGYTNSLIEGIRMAKGKYIARMDSDDISMPLRFEKQIAFLEANTDYGLVGSFIQTIQQEQGSEIWKYPEEDDAIRLFCMVNSPFAHPTVMIRKEVLDENQLMYKAAFEPCEDFKLWIDLLKCTKGKNLPEVLLQYRLHNQQTIALNKTKLIENSNKIRQQLMNNFFKLEMREEDLLNHYYFFNEIK